MGIAATPAVVVDVVVGVWYCEDARSRVCVVCMGSVPARVGVWNCCCC